MNKREYAKLKKWTDTLTDEELKKEYYDALYDSLGSQTEEMYERGYDIADILEREKYERWLSRQSDMLEMICSERGIALWEEYSQKGNKQNGIKFYSLKDKTPEIKERVLIRCSLNEYELGTWEYDQNTKQYGVYVPDDLDMGVLNYVYEKDIVGCMPVSDLDKIEPLL